MTVKELYNWCKACRHKDAQVYLVRDWEKVGEEQGNLIDLVPLKDITTQYVTIDVGMDFEDVTEVLLDCGDIYQKID